VLSAELFFAIAELSTPANGLILGIVCGRAYFVKFNSVKALDRQRRNLEYYKRQAEQGQLTDVEVKDS
jgi:hypothetical protein